MITLWFYMQVLTQIGARRFYCAFYLNIFTQKNMSPLYDRSTLVLKNIYTKVVILEARNVLTHMSNA